MKLTSSKYLIYPICSIFIFAIFSSIKHSPPDKREILRKTEEKIPDQNSENEQIIANIYYTEKNNSYTVLISPAIDKDAIAYAIYNKSYQRTGWDYLAISAYEKKDDKYNDSMKAYAMGYIEGYITKDAISHNFFNMIHFHPEEYKMPEKLKEFVQKNIEYMKQNAEKKMLHEEYWEHVYYIYQQLYGLYNGYIAAVGKNVIGFYEFIHLNSKTDLDDVASAHSNNFPYDFKKMNVDDIRKYTMLKSHCSALIKLAEDFSDIWFGHNTWYTYNSMLRIFKEYRFVTKNGYEKSKTTAFPSYPGLLFSSDDFYYLDSNLLVMETTNPIYNNSLYEKIKPECLLTWVREILANRLAASSEDWPKIFKEENSGTYNNQFMILDLNKINLKNKVIPDKSLMIIEQYPGEFEINDVTRFLRNGYWPSYNIPFSEHFFNISGIIDRIKEKPELKYDIDYKECSRAQIYKRDQNKIKTNNDFGKMLRFNNFKNDDLSYNKAYLTIAARYDLDQNKTYCYGATDVKYISVKEILEGNSLVHIISGPTNDQLPTFSWSNATCKPYDSDKNEFEGLMDVYNKTWVDYKTQLFETKKNDDKEKDSTESDKESNVAIIALSVVSGVLLICLILFIILFYRTSRKLKDLNFPSGKIGLIEKS